MAPHSVVSFVPATTQTSTMSLTFVFDSKIRAGIIKFVYLQHRSFCVLSRFPVPWRKFIILFYNYQPLGAFIMLIFYDHLV